MSIPARGIPLVVFVLVLSIGCGGEKRPSIQDLRGGEDLSLFTLGSLRGTRDADRLVTEAMFSDSSSVLTMEMRFVIGSPTSLESGGWRWARHNRVSAGTVQARSVTFLGGQSGPPSIGGAFDLIGADGSPRYRVTIPVSELKQRSSLATRP